MNVTAQVLSSTSIVVRWNEVPPINQNGEIVGYDLIYEPLETFSGSIGQTLVNGLPASSLGLTLFDLEEYVRYNISVRASTQVGPGPFSVPITTVTDETSKYYNKFFIVGIGANHNYGYNKTCSSCKCS